jgi:hypothetical protein
MERGIKYKNLRFAGHGSETTLDTHKVSNGVKRCESLALLELSENVVCHKDRLGEISAAVDNAVTDSLDLVHICDNADLLVGECVNYVLHSRGVILHRSFLNYLNVLKELLVSDARALAADSFAYALSGHYLGLGVDELILKRT